MANSPTQQLRILSTIEQTIALVARIECIGLLECIGEGLSRDTTNPHKDQLPSHLRYQAY